MQVNKSVPIAGKCRIAVIPLTKKCIPLLVFISHLCLSTCTITFYLMLKNSTHGGGMGEGERKGAGVLWEGEWANSTHF